EAASLGASRHSVRSTRRREDRPVVLAPPASTGLLLRGTNESCASRREDKRGRRLSEPRSPVARAAYSRGCEGVLTPPTPDWRGPDRALLGALRTRPARSAPPAQRRAGRPRPARPAARLQRAR